ncbi:hypothetical protein chiPu_0008842 [Chiloscyllium punctatum]|uniref:RNA helicase n=1 Tax=Chiloscyllium punctatum TaxID=137246 RepID=A0A401SJ21_CHIPU|nr:hypothetical protein [Chiloscyllium punctatum]
MIRNLLAQQIQDWFTIGKTVTGVELLADASSLEEEVKPEKPRLKRCELEQMTEAEHVNSSRDQKEPQNTHWEALPEADSSLLENDDEYLPGISLRTSRPRLSTLKTISMMQVADYRYPELPITKHREQLVDLIENNSVVIVRGATGSGKSTQLPQYILEYYLKKPAFCNIVVTQPRKIGAISIARWICKERCLSIGGLVGYQVGLEKEVGADTQLTYMTTGVLLQKIVNAKCLTEFTHIFIDEVILMSATINCMEFADYFAVPFRKTLTPAYVFEVDGVPYSVDEYYLDDLKELIHFQISPSFCNEPKILPEVYNTAVTLILYFDELENKENGSTGMNLNRGSVLVFLPGLAEINYLHEVLTSMVQKRLHVYPLHSSVTLEEQSNAFLTPVPGYRKIILSTNIAESSVTVSDVKYVVDFCLTRHLVCDEDTNYQSLRLSWASKMSCNQRKGRAGRVSKGYCYRLVTCDFWTHCIPDHAVPEMQRCPLGSTVLKVKLLDMGEPRALLASALSPPNLKDIERTVLLLKEVGALSIEIKGVDNPYDGDLTFLGKVLAYLPVDLHLGKLIVLGHVFGCLEECLIIAAALSLKNFFAVPFKQHLEGYRNKMEYSDGTLSDCIALVNAFKAWRTCREQGQLRFPRAELEWGKSNYIQIKRIKEVAQLYEELKERVQCFNMCVDHPSGWTNEEYVHKQRFILQVVLAGAFYPNYFTFGPVSEEIAMKELARKDYKTTVVVRNVPPYGFLYYQQLLSLFRQCGQIRALSFDGSKGFIEFVQNPIKRAQIHPAVYMALKMAHQRIPLQLKVHSVEEIELLIQGQPSSGLRSPRFCVGYQNWTVQLMPEEKSQCPLELPCNPVPRFFTMNVTEVVEVGHFWGYRTDGQSLHTLSKLMTEINQLKLTALSLEPCPDFCLAPFTECNETHYYRAKILQVSGNSAEVFFVDYGNTAKVAIDLLRNIPHNLLELPFQISHEQLKTILDSSLQEKLGLTQKTVWTQKEEDWKHIQTLIQKFSSSKLGFPSSTVHLHGPYSPYETKFHSMTTMSRFRNVWIEKESINSVSLNNAPEDTHQRMLIGASVSVNTSGSTIIVRETTLMPNIHGLPALICLLFAPVVELRTERRRKYYTGALCGLGWNPINNAPLLEEHNLEVVFDVHFDVNDIMEINLLRSTINMLVCDGLLRSGNHEKIRKLQNEARQRLIDIFTGKKLRESITPQYCERPYKWNQVDPSLLLNQSREESKTVLYQMHSIVLLNP